MNFLDHPTITDAKGFTAAAVRAGFKRKRRDLCLIKSEVPAHCAAKFTTNRVKAAPVLAGIAALHKSGGKLQALVVNSGNANAGTGEQGLRDVHDTIACAAEHLGVPAELILAASTGVIGHYLDMARMRKAVARAASHLSVAGGAACAEAILTTDTIEKAFTLRLEVGGRPVTLCGITKGSGMIMPNMATTLAFVTCDAAIDHALLDRLFTAAVDKSYNMISVDGHTSTNDTALIMANGLAGNAEILPDTPEAAQFAAALDALMLAMAKAIVRDGEGATKFVTIAVGHAESAAAAKRMAMGIANSPLVKTALFGQDPNWGRLLSAAGMVGVEFDPDQADLRINGTYIFSRGNPVLLSRREMKGLMAPQDIDIELDVFTGGQSAVVYTSDLSYDYVKINAEYHT
ncbi:MAG TPA: bifunctional glutamate N-acetyltransferase/amino-acid acetyltransferase ArgJ [bacterium]|nr:bifunctional glutamate N-acetyltransferase/amino-acid acetyltransferase ArgJ [bacterium]